MICRIADLIVQISEAGGMASRCGDYLVKMAQQADIVIREQDFLPPEEYASEDMRYYMETGYLFYWELLKFGGMYLHAAAVEYRGQAYLFSGPSGVGKSTHTRLWQQTFGDAVQVFNDDKPALRFLDGQWYAYGTPWCGKDGINQNKKVPLAGICFLKQGQSNCIRRLPAAEAIANILAQTISSLNMERKLLLMSLVDKLLRFVPVYELENKATEEAARLSRDTMCADVPE